MALKTAEWAGKVAQRVGKRVEHFREKGSDGQGRKVSVQAIADRCAELGLPLDRAVLAKLEKGQRQMLTVGELLVLAEALGVPPILLLFPLGAEETVEVLPGRQMPTWDAVKWFSGHGSPSEDWRQSSIPTQLWAEHDLALVSWLEAPDFMVKSQSLGVPPEDAVRNMQASRRLQENNLRTVRARIRFLGLTPPALPEGLKHIDQSDASELPSGGDQS
jgi:transcriptional regulator with XRE-family HTH domain